MVCLLAVGELIRRSRCVVIVAVLWFVCLSPAQAQQRVALVVGNGAYTGEAALPNAVRDAELMAEGFNSLGFRVTLHRNLDQAGLKRALQAFETEATGAEVAAIYFAGHGIAVDGRNWMLPVDAKLASARHVDDEAVAHTRFIAAVDGAKGLQIIILDACRNNPYAPRLARQAGARNVGARGLEPIPDRDLPPNRLVAFSARDGQVAQDGPAGSNGPYATALRRRMAESGTEIGLLFRRVRDDVVAATRSTQEPWAYSSLGGQELYLLPAAAATAAVPAAPAAPTPAGPSPEAVELAFWQTIQSSRNLADFEAYLAQYPQGRFAALARNRLSDLAATTTPPVPKPEVASQTAQSPAPADECDRLAQPPRSTMGRIPSFAEGVLFEKLDGAAALAACERAMQRYPEEARFVYLRGRALARLNRDTEAARFFRVAAEQGFALGQNGLGWMYANGRGVAKNDSEAVRLYRLAASQGYVPAQVSLGWMYATGRGVAKNDSEAARLYRLAASQGYVPAQVNLGWMYANGRGVAKNDSEAARLYRLAADQGNAEAQSNLGTMYANGLGVEKNDSEAVLLYRLAAVQGDASAQRNLGIMYANGLGVAKNDSEAVRHYRLAADQGDARAQYYLATRYEHGHGGAKNELEAIRFYRLAARQGDTDAQDSLRRLNQTW